MQHILRPCPQHRLVFSAAFEQLYQEVGHNDGNLESVKAILSIVSQVERAMLLEQKNSNDSAISAVLAIY